MLRGVSRPLLTLTVVWLCGAACDVYDGTDLPLPRLAQAGNAPSVSGMAGADSAAAGATSDGGENLGGSGGSASVTPSGGGNGGTNGEAGSAEPASNGGTAANSGSAGNGGTAGGSEVAGSGGTAGSAGKAGPGGAAGSAGGGAISPCVAHPLTPRSSWIATASSSDNGSPPSNAIDGDLTDRWSTGLQQSNADWLQLDFGAVVGIDHVILELGANNPTDYPRGYTVRFSNTSNDLAAPVLLSGAGQQATDTVLAFGAPVSGRYLLIAQTGTAKALWWSVAEIAVACSH
jgi:hypothetical protein